MGKSPYFTDAEHKVLLSELEILYIRYLGHALALKSKCSKLQPVFLFLTILEVRKVFALQLKNREHEERQKKIPMSKVLQIKKKSIDGMWECISGYR